MEASPKPSSATSASSTALPIPLLTANSEIFTPSETTFKPLPYSPNPNAGIPKSKPVGRPAGSSQLLDSSAQESASTSSVSADPSPQDPDVFFVRAPFTTFPDSARHNNLLTYKLLSENLNWFLDVSDFRSKVNSSSNAMTYPPELEPPRGWCVKKRELKERGLDSWPEGEEPRLRCTFCRRTYAGVNAKSMWRRHVYEKHKIAMANRRDSADQTKGRSANKENKTSRLIIKEHQPGPSTQVAVSPDAPSLHEKLLFLDESPAVAVRVSGSSGGGSALEPCNDEEQGPKVHDLTQRPSTPNKAITILDAVEPALSPYDPHRTPQFRYSPKRQTADVFIHASPSNPLYAQRDQPLTALNLTGRRPRLMQRKSSTPYTSLDDLSDDEFEGSSSPVTSSPELSQAASDLFSAEDDFFGASNITTTTFELPDNGSSFSCLSSSPVVPLHLKRRLDSDSLEPLGMDLINMSSGRKSRCILGDEDGALHAKRPRLSV